MARVIRAPAALDDAAEIWAYIAKIILPPQIECWYDSIRYFVQLPRSRWQANERRNCFLICG
jgi:hypothetical protein